MSQIFVLIQSFLSFEIFNSQLVRNHSQVIIPRNHCQEYFCLPSSHTDNFLLPHNNSHIEQNSLLDTNLSLWEVWQRIYLITLVYEVYTGSSQSTHPSRKSSVWELLQHLLCRKFGNEFSSQHRGSLLGLGEKALYWNFGNEFRPSSLWEVLLRI